MADVVYINEAEGKKRVMNNAKLYVKLLGKFKNDTNMGDLLNHADAQDWEKAQGSIHAIKGLAANLSLTELFNQSLEVETQIRGRALKPEAMENLKSCFAETINHVDRVIAEDV